MMIVIGVVLTECLVIILVAALYEAGQLRRVIGWIGRGVLVLVGGTLLAAYFSFPLLLS